MSPYTAQVLLTYKVGWTPWALPQHFPKGTLGDVIENQLQMHRFIIGTFDTVEDAEWAMNDWVDEVVAANPGVYNHCNGEVLEDEDIVCDWEYSGCAFDEYR